MTRQAPRASLAVRLTHWAGDRLVRAYPRALSSHAAEARAFLDDAIDEAWAESGWRGAARILARLSADIAATRWRGAALPLTDRSAYSSDPAARPFLRGSHAMESLAQDVRHSLRSLARTPAFTLVAFLTLALGIGMTTAVYTVVDQSMLRPFPYPDIDRIVLLTERSSTGQSMSVSWPNFQDWRGAHQPLSELGVYRNAAVNLTGSEPAERLSAAIVSASVFQTTGIVPMRGRVFSSDDDRPGSARVAVISERLWRVRFGGAPDVVGRTVLLDNEPHTIVGVMPAAMRFPSRLTDVWLSLGPSVDTFPAARDNHPGLTAIGRLAPGVTLDAARRGMTTVAARLSTEYPATNRGSQIVVRAYGDVIVESVRPAFRLLLGAVGLVLILACANLASLMLARAESRQRELAVRAALGAGRLRLVRQLMTEALVLALAGGAAGVALAYWAVAVFVASHPTTIPRIDLVRIDPRILLSMLAVTIATGVLFGTAPAISGSRVHLQDSLRGGRGGWLGGAARLRAMLVTAEVAMALMLLVGAALLGRSLTHLLAVDLGFDPSREVTLQVALPQTAYPTLDGWRAFHATLLGELAHAPDVESAGLTTSLPLSGNAAESSLLREGDPMPTPDHPAAECSYSAISADYFRTMGIGLSRGRAFGPDDTAGGVPVAVVDDTLVAALFPDRDPIGRRVAFEFRGDITAPKPIWREIVGVVRHVKQYGLIGEPPYLQVFVPYQQLPIWMQDRRPPLSVVIRTRAAPEATVAAMRQAVAAINPAIPVYGVQTMDEAISESIEQPRESLALFAAFAVLALVIAVVGLYGVLSHLVAQRTREIGLRMALGAQRGRIARLVSRQAASLVGAGLVLGLAGAVGLSRFLAALLVDVSPTDPPTFAAVALILVTVAAVAAAIPAHRASSVDPVIALRD